HVRRDAVARRAQRRELGLSARVLALLSDPPPPQLYTLSLHDALPISLHQQRVAAGRRGAGCLPARAGLRAPPGPRARRRGRESGDRKSTRLNSSHQISSYAAFRVKKAKHPAAGESAKRDPVSTSIGAA